MSDERVEHGPVITMSDLVSAITEENSALEAQFKTLTPLELRRIGPKLIEAIMIYGTEIKVEGNIWATWSAFAVAPLEDLLENAPRACARFAATLLGTGNASA